MPYDGSGNFSRSYNFVSDRDNAIKIQAARVDGEFDNYSTALNSVILRNGVVPFSGDVLLAGNKITGVGVGAVATPSISMVGDVSTGMWFPAAGVVAWSSGGTERARAHSTGFSVTGKFGIGTNTPRTSLDVIGLSSFRGALEDVNITSTAATGTVQFNFITAAVMMITSNATANWTFNIRGDAATTLNSLMAVGQMLTLAVEVPQGTTAYYCTGITVDGAAPAAIKWAGGGAPSAGHTSAIDVYLIRITKTADGVFLVRASQSQEK